MAAGETGPAELVSDWEQRHPPPSLEALVVRYGGYRQIPVEAWDRYHAELTAWQRARLWRWMR